MSARTILVVDDEISAALASALQEHALKYNWKLITAIDGEQCLQIARKSAPDLMLLDIDLPVLNGFEVLSQLTQLKIETRVIMLSGYHTDIDTAIRCVKGGACDYLIKANIETLQLVDRIRRALFVEAATNLRLSDLSSPARALVEEASLLKTNNDRLEAENKKLKDRFLHIIAESIQKLILVSVAVVSVIALTKSGVIQSGQSIAVVFAFLALILLLPSQRIQSVSAGFAKIYTRIKLRGKDEGE